MLHVSSNFGADYFLPRLGSKKTEGEEGNEERGGRGHCIRATLYLSFVYTRAGAPTLVSLKKETQRGREGKKVAMIDVLLGEREKLYMKREGFFEKGGWGYDVVKRGGRNILHHPTPQPLYSSFY